MPEADKIERIRELARRYYRRRDIQKALVSFSPNREVSPRYIDSFGKRPDALQYESDVSALAERGATSFHCSEELWHDPLQIKTEMNEEQFNKLRIGWDLLLDIDTKYIEYGKIAAELLTEELRLRNVNNFGIKFSGGSGFHICIPWKAFPKQIGETEIKNLFPKIPRYISLYLIERIEKKLSERILALTPIKEISEIKGIKKENLMKKICKNCGGRVMKSTKNIRTEIGKKIIEREIEDLECISCGNSFIENPNQFEKIEQFDPFSIIELDTILLSPRHLFRMPYSLHEKSGLSSIVIKPEQIKNFQPSWAKPDIAVPKQYLPEAEENEAKELVMEALDADAERKRKTIKSTETDKRVFKVQINIKDLSPSLYPPCIQAILNGVKQDGRKRALFILLNFFKSIQMNNDEIEKNVTEWNKKNYKQLREGYIKSQLFWFKRQKAILPPNCDKPNYKDLAVCNPDSLCKLVKNPINYVVRKARFPNKKKITKSDKKNSAE